MSLRPPTNFHDTTLTLTLTWSVDGDGDGDAVVSDTGFRLSHMSGFVRSARLEDAARLSELLEQPADISGMMKNGEFLVLDGPNGLLGSVHVRIEGERGHLDLAVHGSRKHDGELCRRLVKVAEGVCQARGCREVELSVKDGTDPRSWLHQSTGYRAAGPASAAMTYRL